MDFFAELHKNIVAALEDRGGKMLHRTGIIDFCCPVHNDNDPSAWLSEYSWGCWVCGIKRNLRDLAELLDVPLPSNDYTIEDYAKEKNFDLEKLKKWKLSTVEIKGSKVLCIPYMDKSVGVLRNRYRSRSGGRWWEGHNKDIFLYGLWVLEDIPNSKVILVEGESDCHAAWHHKVLALGVPGADTWNSDWNDYLKGREVYVWQEPDQGGDTFIKKIARNFPNAKLIRAGDYEVKDLADLHLTYEDNFEKLLQKMMQEAYAIGTPEPPTEYDAVVGETLDHHKEWLEAPIEAVRTPFPSWNKVCRGAGGGKGLAKGWHVVLAGSSGFGKSIIGANCASEGVKQGERVGIISLEMAQQEMLTRFLAIHTETPVRLLEKGTYDPKVYDSVTRRMNEEYARTGGVLFLNRRPIKSLEDVLDSMRFLFEVRGCEYFIIDYLQIARVAGTSDNLLSRVEEVSGEVSSLGKDILRVTTLGLSQFNREVSKNREERPYKEGLQGGSPLENDSDQVGLLDHSRINRVQEGLQTYFLIDKNRHGPSGYSQDIPIIFNTKTLRMMELQLETENVEFAS